MSLEKLERLLQNAPRIPGAAVEADSTPGTRVRNQRPAHMAPEGSYPGMAEVRAAQRQHHTRVVLLTAASPLEAGRAGALA